jgi:alpha-tubulin suppressor-like RCC1 family protein
MHLACGGGAGESREGFSSAITEDGVLLAFGCGDKGQLGNGRFCAGFCLRILLAALCLACPLPRRLTAGV